MFFLFWIEKTKENECQFLASQQKSNERGRGRFLKKRTLKRKINKSLFDTKSTEQRDIVTTMKTPNAIWDKTCTVKISRFIYTMKSFHFSNQVKRKLADAQKQKKITNFGRGKESTCPHHQNITDKLEGESFFFSARSYYHIDPSRLVKCASKPKDKNFHFCSFVMGKFGETSIMQTAHAVRCKALTMGKYLSVE